MRDEQKRRISELAEDPVIQDLRAWVKEVRDLYYQNLARELYAHPGKISEADLVYKQGYFAGMARLLNEPLLTLQTVERDLAKKEVTE